MASVTRAKDLDGQYGQGSTAFSSTSPVRLDQLSVEANVAIAAYGDLDHASTEEPVTLVLPEPKADAAAFLKAATAHKPDPAWTAPDPS